MKLVLTTLLLIATLGGCAIVPFDRGYRGQTYNRGDVYYRGDGYNRGDVYDRNYYYRGDRSSRGDRNYRRNPLAEHDT